MSENIVTVSPENAQRYLIDESRQRLVIVDFWAPWCAPCKVLLPILEKLADEYAGQLLLAKVNADEQQAIVAQFGVRSLPTVMLMRDGQPIDGFAGAKTEAELRELIDKHLPKAWELDWQRAKSLLAEDVDAAGVMPEAMSLLKTAYVDSGQRADIAFDYCRCLLVEQRLQQAQEILDAVTLADQNSDYQQLKAQLDLALEAGRAPELTLLEQELKDSPDDVALAVKLAVQYAQHKHEEDALALLYAYLQQDLNALDGELRKSFSDILASLAKGDALATRYQRKFYTLLY